MKSFSVVIFMLLAAMGFCAGKSLELVRDGIPDASIVLAEKPTAGAQLAAFELQHVICLITGAELPIVRSESQIKGVSVFVGESPGTIRRNMKTADFKAEEYAVRFFPDAIVLMGSDDPEYREINYNNLQTFPSLEQNLHASLYAVYDFLEQFCNVRFYLPGDLGIAFTPRKTLVVEHPCDIQRHPFMSAMRNINFCDPHLPGLLRYAARFGAFEAPLANGYQLRHGEPQHDESVLQLLGPAKHQSFTNLFIEKRPEYFAQGYEGKYSGFMPWAYPGDPDIPSQVCSTNPDVICLLAEQVVNAYRGGQNPGSTYPRYRRISGMPFTYPMLFEDTNAHCKCKRCEDSLSGKPQAERNAWRYFNFVNAIAEEAAKSEPEAGIGTGAYGTPYVEGIQLHKNLSLQIMLGIHAWYFPGVAENHKEFYQAWKKKAGDCPVTLWTYMLAPCWEARRVFKYNQFFPGFYPEATVRIFRGFTKDGVKGWFCETFLEFNFLENYLAARLCDNPEIDAGKELADFFKYYFGAASETMREYYKEVENTFWNPDNYPQELRNRKMGMLVLDAHTDRVNWGLGTLERLAKLDALFLKAKEQAANDTEKARLKLFEDRIHRQMMEGREKFQQREKNRCVPVSKLVVPMISLADGDPARADWMRAERVQNLKTLFGKDDPLKMELRFAHDHHTLYLSYRESDAPPEHAKAKNDPWLNSVELFVGKSTTYPFNHLVVTPDGTVTNYLHKEVNGVVSYGKVPLPVAIVNQEGKSEWAFQLAISLKSLLPDGAAVKPGDELYLNVMRSRTGGPALAWSPTFDEGYLRSLYRMGQILIGGAEASSGAALQTDFTKMKHLLYREWRVPNHVAKSGKVELCERGIHFTADSGNIFITAGGRRFLAGSGNAITVTLTASGKGRGYVGICGYQRLPGEKEKEITYQAESFELTEQLTPGRLVLPVCDSKNGRVTHVTLILGALKGSEMTVGKLEMQVK